MFGYKEKLGFVGEKEGGFFFFNGQKISQDFDEIRTYGCCVTSAYPIEFVEKGTGQTKSKIFFCCDKAE